MVKSLPAMRETLVRFLGQEDPWRRKWHAPPVFLPGKSHGQRSLAGYSPWGRKQLDMIKQLTLSLSPRTWKTSALVLLNVLVL